MVRNEESCRLRSQGASNANEFQAGIGINYGALQAFSSPNQNQKRRSIMDFSLYWFMFPVAICVATSAMLSGIGGAALFMPIFLLVFPLLGPEYMLASPVAAIAVALLTETFGFSSGFIGYYRKRLIDFGQSKTFLVIAVPAAISGALLSHLINPTMIRGSYGLLMLILAVILLRGHDVPVEEIYGEDMYTDDDGHPGSELNEGAPHIVPPTDRSVTDREGVVYSYREYKARPVPTGVGGFLSGLLSAGIGEVVMPRLVKEGRVPVPVAAATSVLVVIITVMSASFTHIATLISEGGVNAVPWHLVAYTIPGVIIGGQIGPRLQGKVASHTMERIIGGLFLVIGIAMMVTVFQDLFS